MEKQKLIDTILNLPKNKEFKREKIQNVIIELDNDCEMQFIIETDFAELLIGIIFNDDDTISSYGNIISTAYREIDDLLYNLYDESILGDWFIDFDSEFDINIILEEIFNQINQDDWKVKFKLLWKAYNTFEKIKEQCDELDVEYLLDEMARNYFDK